MKRILTWIMVIGLVICAACGCSDSSPNTPMQSGSSKSGAQNNAQNEDFQEIADDELGLQAMGEDGAAPSGKQGEGTQETTNDNDNKDTTQKLVYTASVSVETKKYEESLSALRKSIASCQGIVEKESESNNDYSWTDDQAVINGGRRNEMTIRIPTEKYDAFLSGIDQYGIVTDKSSNVENITKRYRDTETRQKALKAQEKRLLEMMEKAKTIDEMITVEKRLTEVQTELELTANEISTMDTDVAYSTVYLTLSEVTKEPKIGKQTFGQRFVEAIHDSLASFILVLEGAIIALVYLLPHLIVIGLVALVIFLIVRFIKKRNPPKMKPNKPVYPKINTESMPDTQEKPEKTETEKN